MTCGIYKIENLINHKKYIGQSIEIEKRWKKHLSAKDDFIIHKALRKYGKDNFSFEIIEQCIQKDLDKKEQYWIQYYNSLIPNGYNMNEGGSSLGSHKPLAILQFDMSGKFIQKFDSLREACEQLNFNESGLRNCCKGESAYSNNFQWRYENYDKLLQPVLNLVDTGYIHYNYPVLQYDMNLQLIKKYPNLATAALETNIAKSTISNACRGKACTAGGFKWAYENNLENIDLTKKSATAKKCVGQYDLSNNLIATYESISEASRQTNISIPLISAVCNNKRKTTHNFKWKFITN